MGRPPRSRQPSLSLSPSSSLALPQILSLSVSGSTALGLDTWRLGRRTGLDDRLDSTTLSVSRPGLLAIRLLQRQARAGTRYQDRNEPPTRGRSPFVYQAGDQTARLSPTRARARERVTASTGKKAGSWACSHAKRPTRPQPRRLAAAATRSRSTPRLLDLRLLSRLRLSLRR